MTTPESTTFIIVGLTKEGRKFRPSDWAERLCGVMSAFGAEHKVKYSPYVGPGDYNGQKAVFVDGREGSLAAVGLGNDLDVGLGGEHQVQPAAVEHVVVDDHHAGRRAVDGLRLPLHGAVHPAIMTRPDRRARQIDR